MSILGHISGRFNSLLAMTRFGQVDEMRTLKILGYSLLVTAMIWLVMAWPLPRYFDQGIPTSSDNIEKGNVRSMMPGDHLQFLYHLWLAQDTFLGHTPFFHNLYEFNTGNDSERYETSRYYFPFSIFFTLASLIGSQAFAWNVTGFMSIWITLIFTFILVRRYTTDLPSALFASTLAILLPYRWYTLLGGSPTGLSMMWIPIALYGIDLMMAEKKWTGALLAAVAVYISGWSDTHVFFYSLMLAPVWCVISAIYHADRYPLCRREIRRLLIAASPLVLFAVLFAFQALRVKNKLSHTAVGAVGRTLNEIDIFSPHLTGLLFRDASAVDGTLYTGFALLLLLLAGLLAMAIRGRRAIRWLALIFLLLLAGGYLLATGTKNPGGPRAWQIFIKVVPPYGMIRQSAKIMCVFPTLIAVVVAMGLPLLIRARLRIPLYLAMLMLLLVDYGGRVDPTICLLDHEQGAYRAVAEDAQAMGVRPHIIALPLWPGNSAYTSINQYYISLYRIRMINGYRPTVKTAYFEQVFQLLQSFNRGVLRDHQLDGLLQRGIRYIILHEDVFPEKVSPFPVGTTLQSLLTHPRLQFLKQDRTAWAFKILDAPRREKTAAPPWNYHFPARRFEAEAYATDARIVTNDTASNGRYVALSENGGTLKWPVESVPELPHIHWLMRARGNGRLHIADTNATPATPRDVDVNSTNWTWINVPWPDAVQLTHSIWPVIRAEGSVDLDMNLFVAGDWTRMGAGETVELPAPCFFHAGYIDPADNTVNLRAEHDPEAIVFYGPKLPLPAGRYRVDFRFTSDAADDTELGRFNLRRRESDDANWTSVRAGRPAQAFFDQPDNQPVFLAFLFLRNADLAIRAITLTRVE